MKLKFILILFALFAFKIGHSHALWIETSPIGTINKSHQIKVFFGEYAHQEISPLEKWYSDLKEFKLFLVGPDNKKIQLETKPFSDHFEASFIPESDGVYQVMVLHPAKEPYETMAFEFSSNASIKVGKNAKENFNLDYGIKLSPQTIKIGDSIRAHIFSEKAVLPNTEVEVISPSGWTKTLKSDENGIVSFLAKEKGVYLLETSIMEEKTSDWFGKTVDKIWKGSTASAIVN